MRDYKVVVTYRGGEVATQYFNGYTLAADHAVEECAWENTENAVLTGPAVEEFYVGDFA